MATVKRPRTTKATKTAPTNKAETRNSNVTEMAKVTTQTVDMQEAIRARAYELYAQRGYEHGRDFEDWVRAEAEVLSHFGARTA
jgi:hypothetical protein